MLAPVDPTTLAEWDELRQLAAAMPPIGSLVDERFLVASSALLTLDYTRQRVDAEVLRTLFALSDSAGVPQLREAMFAGEHINTTEDRPALHTALRGTADSADARTEVNTELDRMSSFAEGVRTGRIHGLTGKSFRTVINIGIGGSDLGPRMAYQALAPYRDPDIDVRFVANVDPSALDEALADADPQSTLILIASKTFTTSETMANAARAKAWLQAALGGDAPGVHMAAISVAQESVQAFGLTTRFGFWEWVGGRYSIGSAIGLSLMIAVGPGNFRSLLDGFAEIDRNFRTAPHTENLPLIMGLLSIWNRNFLGIETLAVLPYAHRLRSFPEYLQQLVMESNGKMVRRDGVPVTYATSPILWGQAGTGGQHSFHQLIHQGTSNVACDVIIVGESGGDSAQQRSLVAHALAQAEVFARGHADHGGVTDHRTIPGNRPTNVIIGGYLDPQCLGALIALYEHSVFVQGALWGINPFDQFGVELGKNLASRIEHALQSGDLAGISSLTQRTIAYLPPRSDP